MTDDDERSEGGAGGFQDWIEQNRGKIWIWGIGGLALAGVGCMFLVVLILILRQ